MGDRLGRYELVQRLGKGGMGEVWIAEDTALRRRVAVKVIAHQYARDDNVRARFIREAQAAAQLAHPNVAQIYDVGQEGDVAFLAMELVDGESLRARLKNGALPLDEAMRIALGVADGLAAAHAKSFVHRDLKPDNIMLARVDHAEHPVPKVLDFGLAKRVDGADLAPTDATDQFSGGAGRDPQLTETGMVVGTPAYMSPEQASGRPVDARSDVFAFGVILTEMITGKPAFTGSSSFELIASILRDPPRPLPPSTPPALSAAVARCLEKDPAARFSDARALRAALGQVTLTAPSSSSSQSLPLDAATETALPAQTPPPAAAPPTPASAALQVSTSTVATPLKVRAQTDALASAPQKPRLPRAARAVLLSLAAATVLVICAKGKQALDRQSESEERAEKREKRERKERYKRGPAETSTRLPTVSEDVATQGAFAAAVKSFWDVDFTMATRQLVELEQKTGATIPLAAAMLAFMNGDARAAERGLVVAKPDTLEARLLTHLRDVMEGRESSDRDLPDDLEDTYLHAALFALTENSTLEEQDKRLAALLERDPAPALLWVFRAERPCNITLPDDDGRSPRAAGGGGGGGGAAGGGGGGGDGNGELDEARQQLRRVTLEMTERCDRILADGLRNTGSHRRVLQARARARWIRKDLAGARQDFEVAVHQALPHEIGAHTLFAGLSLDIGDDARAAQLIEHVRKAKAAPDDFVAERLTAHAQRLAARGRAKEADVLLDDAVARARKGRHVRELLGAHRARMLIASTLGLDVKKAKEGFDVDVRASGVLATAAGAGDLIALGTLLDSAQDGKLDVKFAQQLLDGIKDQQAPLGGVWTPERLLWLAQLDDAVDAAAKGGAGGAAAAIKALAVSEGVPEGELDLHDEDAQAALAAAAALSAAAGVDLGSEIVGELEKRVFTDHVPPGGRCELAMQAARIHRRVGDDSGAGALYAVVRSHAGICSFIFDEREKLCLALVAESIVGWAEVQLAVGDPEQAAAALQELDAVWPKPDATMPTVKRAAALRKAIAAER